MEMIITEKWLKQRHACQDGIDFVVRNKVVPLNYDEIKIAGDYGGYYHWLKFTMECKNKIIYEPNSIKFIYSLELDKFGNKTKWIKSNGKRK